MPVLDAQASVAAAMARERDVESGDAQSGQVPEGLTQVERDNWPYRSVSDDRLNPRLEQTFPLLYAYRNLVYHTMPEVAASGSNVSPYAAAWWRKWSASATLTDNAMNETVAEIAKLSAVHARNWPGDAPARRIERLAAGGVGPEWVLFHDAVMAAGRRPSDWGAAVKAGAAGEEAATVIGPDGWGERHEADGTIRLLRPARVRKYAPDQPRGGPRGGEGTERLVAIASDGRVVIDKEGTKHQVGFTAADVALLKAAGPGLVLTHNHPRGGGYSLSPEDVDLATSVHAAKIRAVGARAAYRGWTPACASRRARRGRAGIERAEPRTTGWGRNGAPRGG